MKAVNPRCEPSGVPYASIRVQLRQAEEKIRTAAGMLRRHKMPENARELMRSHDHLRVWTQPDGWLDQMERQK